MQKGISPEQKDAFFYFWATMLEDIREQRKEDYPDMEDSGSMFVDAAIAIEKFRKGR